MRCRFLNSQIKPTITWTSGAALLSSLLFAASFGLTVVTTSYAQETVHKDAITNDNSEEGSSGNNTGAKDGVITSPDTGKMPTSPEEVKLTRMPANTALRGLMDSKQYKEMLKGMITSKVPVMYQTMFMVENGAATGFMGSVQSVSQLMNNSIQSAGLELQMRGVAGPEYQKQFVNAIHDGLKKQETEDKGRNLWPIGLFYASGDTVTEQIDNVKFDYQYNKGDGPASINQHLLSTSKDNGSKDKWTLMNTLAKAAGDSDRRTSEMIEWIKKVIGDVEVQLDNEGTGQSGGSNSNDPALSIKKNFKQPTQKANVKNDSQSGGTVQTKALGGSSGSQPLDGFTIGDQIFGASVERNEIRKDVWRNMYKLLGEYCKFKKDNPNSMMQTGEELFKKKMVWQTITPDLIKKVSSNHFKVSLNLIDQIFKVWVQTSSSATTPTQIQCNFDNADQEMPENFDISRDVGDNCERDAKKCRRNKWLYRFVDIIALDKLIQNASDAYERAIQLALTNDESIAGLVNELFCASLASHSGTPADSSMCDLGFYFESITGSNKARWHDQLEGLSKLAQSLGGSSNFRFQPNNSFIQQGGGFDARGDANPDAGGGSGSGGGGGAGN